MFEQEFESKNSHYPRSFVQVSARHDMIIPYYSMVKQWEQFSNRRGVVSELRWIDLFQAIQCDTGAIGFAAMSRGWDDYRSD